MEVEPGPCEECRWPRACLDDRVCWIEANEDEDDVDEPEPEPEPPDAA